MRLWNQSSMLHTLTCFVQCNDAMTDGAGHGSPQWHRAGERILGIGNFRPQEQYDADGTGNTGSHQGELGTLMV
jgi:hypothetical protein